ncbi:uncharacterized protein LOC108913030 [Anoplophora glabripennis]|uniref:uncharacterized protein LOC108913030 n=1 Tax=Anoplophora glabripennis TaxID=217634 RepID=UPI0008745E13|nr:uncharacterized protein LOC108913030 [Anoplophora glabripennis]
MFVKLAVLACSLAAAHAAWNGPLAGGQPASLYPAGVSPQACPNFPHCSNPAVAANPNQAAPQQWGNPQPQWNHWDNNNQWNHGSQWNPQPQWNQNNNWNAQPVPQYSNDIQARLNRGEYVGDGDYHGEGLAEALAPGYAPAYGGWQNQGGWNPGPNHGAQQAHGVGQIPAGVDARSCPNYPFCS